MGIAILPCRVEDCPAHVSVAFEFDQNLQKIGEKVSHSLALLVEPVPGSRPVSYVEFNDIITKLEGNLGVDSDLPPLMVPLPMLVREPRSPSLHPHEEVDMPNDHPWKPGDY